MHAEHPGCDPLPQDDVACGYWRSLGHLPHRLHVLLNGVSLNLFLIPLKRMQLWYVCTAQVTLSHLNVELFK